MSPVLKQWRNNQTLHCAIVCLEKNFIVGSPEKSGLSLEWCYGCNNTLALQCNARILNNVIKAINETFTEFEVHASGDPIMFFFEILNSRAENLPAKQLSRYSQNWQNWLSCLNGEFFALKSRILNKIYFEPLKHAL